jgi:hypothetical protein
MITVKYKALAILFLIGITLLVWALFIPKEGLAAKLFNAGNIDSVLIKKNDTLFVVTKRESIQRISLLLKESSNISRPERLKANTGQMNVRFYTKYGVENTRFIYCYYEGIVLKSNYRYYKNDTLHGFLMKLLLN